MSELRAEDTVLDEDWDAFVGELSLWKPADIDSDPQRAAYIDMLLRKAGDVEAERDRIKDQAREMVAKIKAWEATQDAVYARRLEYVEKELKLLAEITDPEPGKKTRSFPHGDIGKRKRPDTVVIENEADALAFSKDQGLEYYTVEEPRVKPLLKYAQAHDKRLPDDSGARYVQGMDEFFYRTRRNG